MKRRGPDLQAHWFEGPVALGHCMLRNTPESLEENQPLLSQDNKLAMVWDGRLDNRNELQRHLKATGVIPRDRSDAELALQSYALWGEACPKRFLGDFAFVVWDARRQRLFCARDHMGARPFYYTCNDSYFAFASEEEVLTLLPGVSRQPNEELIASVLVPDFYGYDGQASWMHDVLALSPAHSLTVSRDGRVQVEGYWRLTAAEEHAYASDAECREAFLQVFGEAVRCRMRSSGDIAVMVSGGLDSAGIVAMVKRLLPEMPGKKFDAYSAISDHPESCLESRCIQSLTQGPGTHAHYLSVPSFSGMAGVDDLIDAAWSEAHPIDNTILLPALMCLGASRGGNRVLLHGASGDLTTYVPGRYPAYFMRNGQWQRAWQECKGASRNNTYLRGTSPVELFMLNAGTAFLPGKLKILARRLLGKGASHNQQIINAAFAQKLNLPERLKFQETESARTMPGSFAQVHVDVLTSLTRGLVLGLTGYEHVAGRYGVELRDPWADKRVVEFFVGLPLEYRVCNGWTKYLVRTAFGEDLDRKVCWRLGKEHLGWHFTARLMNETRPFVANTLAQDLERKLGDYVDVSAIRARLERYALSGSFIDADYLYEIMVLLLWLKRIARLS